MGRSNLDKLGRRAGMPRERHQPGFRKKWGLLEKKKDYKVRAKDYHRKKDMLNKLKEKALLKNPDEFYYRMINSRLDKWGNHLGLNDMKAKTLKELDHLTGQDIRYLKWKNQIEREKIRKMQASMHFIDSERMSTHVKFVKSKRKGVKFEAVQCAQTPHVSEHDVSEATSLGLISQKLLDKGERMNTQQYKELSSRIKRTEKISQILLMMETKLKVYRSQAKGERFHLQKKINKKEEDTLFGSPGGGKVERWDKDIVRIYKWRKERKR